MSKEITHLQQEVEDVRDQLTETLQAIAARTNPKTVANNILYSIKSFIYRPQVLGTIGAATVCVISYVLISKVKRHKEKKNILAAIPTAHSLEALAAELF